MLWFDRSVSWLWMEGDCGTIDFFKSHTGPKPEKAKLHKIRPRHRWPFHAIVDLLEASPVSVASDGGQEQQGHHEKTLLISTRQFTLMREMMTRLQQSPDRKGQRRLRWQKISCCKSASMSWKLPQQPPCPCQLLVRSRHLAGLSPKSCCHLTNIQSWLQRRESQRYSSNLKWICWQKAILSCKPPLNLTHPSLLHLVYKFLLGTCTPIIEYFFWHCFNSLVSKMGYYTFQEILYVS